jgi:putative ABC transport system permease protein
MGLARFLSSEIWEVQADGPGVFVGVALLLVAVAVVASLAPALKALRVDPTIALR